MLTGGLRSASSLVQAAAWMATSPGARHAQLFDVLVAAALAYF